MTGLATTTSPFVMTVALLLLVGCVADAPSRATQRDSAGVRIRESGEARWTESTGWRVSSEPDLAIGTAEGDEPYLFNHVSGAVELGNGDVAVADNGSREIRLFDSSGSFIRSVGRQGSGPGEFRDVGLLARYAGDSLVVFDRDLQRATVFSADLQGFRTMSLATSRETGVPSIRAALDDGSVIARMNLVNGNEQPATLWRDSLLIIRFDRTGRDPTVLLRAPGDDRFTEIQDGVVLNNNHPFGRRPVIASDGTRLFLADGSVVGVDVYAADGRLTEKWRASIPGRPVDRAAVDRMKAVWTGADASPEWSREVERVFSEIALPSQLPAVDAVIVDASACVWLRPFMIGSPETLEWHVFSSDGSYLGGITLPGTFQVTDIGEQYVLGIGQSELGTEVIQRFALSRL